MRLRSRLGLRHVCGDWTGEMQTQAANGGLYDKEKTEAEHGRDAQARVALIRSVSR